MRTEQAPSPPARLDRRPRSVLPAFHRTANRLQYRPQCRHSPLPNPRVRVAAHAARATHREGPRDYSCHQTLCATGFPVDRTRRCGPPPPASADLDSRVDPFHRGDDRRHRGDQYRTGDHHRHQGTHGVARCAASCGCCARATGFPPAVRWTGSSCAVAADTGEPRHRRPAHRRPVPDRCRADDGPDSGRGTQAAPMDAALLAHVAGLLAGYQAAAMLVLMSRAPLLESWRPSHLVSRVLPRSGQRDDGRQPAPAGTRRQRTGRLPLRRARTVPGRHRCVERRRSQPPAHPRGGVHLLAGRRPRSGLQRRGRCR